MLSFRMIFILLRLYFSASNFHMHKTPQVKLRTLKVEFLGIIYIKYCGFSIESLKMTTVLVLFLTLL